jgi:hypothetical protein
VAVPCADGDWSATGEQPCSACPSGYRSRDDRKHCYPFTCSHVFCRHETHRCNTQFQYVAKGGPASALCDGRTHQSVRVYYTGAETQCRGGHSCKMHGAFCRCSPTAQLPDYPHERYNKCDDAPLKTEKLPHGTIAQPLKPHWNEPQAHGGNGLYYICDAGYEITGSSVRTCNRDGTWNGAPICRAAQRLGAGNLGAQKGDDAPDIEPEVHNCICTNGTPTSGAFCTMEGGHRCSSCDSGYHLQGFQCRLTAKTCSCNNGVAAIRVLCPGGEYCTSCDSGYQLHDRKCKAHNTATRDNETGYNGH